MRRVEMLLLGRSIACLDWVREKLAVRMGVLLCRQFRAMGFTLPDPPLTEPDKDQLIAQIHEGEGR